MRLFDCFDDICCINAAPAADAWQAMQARFARLGIAERVRRLAYTPTPGKKRVAPLLAHRRAVADAASAGRRAVLVIEETALLADRGGDELAAAAELATLDWSTALLGGARWDALPPPHPGCRYWFTVPGAIGTPAVAYAAAGFDALLAAVPDDVSAAAEWLRGGHSLERFVLEQPGAVALSPPLAVYPEHLPYEDPDTRHAYAGAAL